MILGTAGYMSPEQARGKPVDKRADIWAFGVVLFEMLTGKPLFEGETVSDTLAQVLTKEPDWEQVPAQVRRLARKCLEKDPKKRLRDIGDAWELLEGPAVIAPSRSRLGWIAAVFAVVSIVLGAMLWRSTRPIDQPLKPLVRLDVDLGPDVSLGSLGSLFEANAIISPDGTRLAYVSQNHLFTRRLDQSKAIELAGTEQAFAPFFSPDSQWVAFFAAEHLKKVSVEGGAAVTLCEAPLSSGGGSWGEDGNIIANLKAGSGGLWRIPSSGGPPTPLTELAPGEAVHRWPQVLPGGKAVLFTANALSTTNFGDFASIEVMSLVDHRRKTLVRGSIFGRYSPSGHLLYLNGGTLFAVPFDLEKLEIRGTPVPVLEEVAYSTLSGAAQLDFSQTGTLVYHAGERTGLFTVQWLDAAGKTQPLLAKPGVYGRPSLSPDGKLLALEVSEGSGSDIRVYDWRRDTMTRLTFTGIAQDPQWSPDGRFIVFQVSESGMSWVRADGAGKPEPLTHSKNVQFPWSFSPSGKRLAFLEQSAPAPWNLWTVPVESEGGGLRAGGPTAFLATPADERCPSFSPDGKWMAYSSDESGTPDIYVRAFPDLGGKSQISNSGGATYPMWSPNGRELFFETLDNRIMVTTYTVRGDSFTAEKPRLWSEKKLGGRPNSSKNVVLAPDGKRVVALMPVDSSESQHAQNHVIFLMNFFDELRRRVPVDK